MLRAVFARRMSDALSAARAVLLPRDAAVLDSAADEAGSPPLSPRDLLSPLSPAAGRTPTKGSVCLNGEHYELRFCPLVPGQERSEGADS